MVSAMVVCRAIVLLYLIFNSQFNIIVVLGKVPECIYKGQHGKVGCRTA